MTGRKFIFAAPALGVLLSAALGIVFFAQGNASREAASAPSASLSITRQSQETGFGPTALPELRSNNIPGESETLTEDGTREQLKDKRGEISGEIRSGPVRAELRAPSQEYVVWVPEESSAYDLMIIAQEHSEFDFGGKNFWGLGFFVEEINGVAQNPKEDMYWIYYINGETALVGVSQYEIQSNDIIEWKYETQN